MTKTQAKMITHFLVRRVCTVSWEEWVSAGWWSKGHQKRDTLLASATYFILLDEGYDV